MLELSVKNIKLMLVAGGLTCCSLHVSAQIIERQPNSSILLQTSERNLYLEVFINDVSTGLLGFFKQFSDGSLATTPEELKDIGLKPATDAIGKDGLIHLNRLSDLSFRIDERQQRLYVRTTDERRMAHIIEIAPKDNINRPVPQSSYGSVFNYSLYLSTDNLVEKNREPFLYELFYKPFRGLSGGFDARFFSPLGVLNQSFTAGLTDGKFNGFKRLNTSWTYSDPEHLITYQAGDLVSSGLTWTRPIFLGGIQIRRNFSLRSDLITIPIPTFSGSAAVPSTLDIYTQNAKIYSGGVPAGPFEVTHFPVFTGAGAARVMITDTLGRERIETFSFYSSSRLLRKGLLDFSAEIGLPRRNYGLKSDDYDYHPIGSFSTRYGLNDKLTLEGHIEGEAYLLNSGIGTVFSMGSLGVGSFSTAGSNHDGRTGSLISAAYELSYAGYSLYGRTQHTFGNYEDIASVTARKHGIPNMIARPPKMINQLAFTIPFTLSNLNLSYTQIEDTARVKSRIIGLSYNRPILHNGSFYATVFKNIDKHNNLDLYAGVSFPLGNNISTSLGVQKNSNGYAMVAEIAKSERYEKNSHGWRLHTVEGSKPNRSASVSYRGSIARVQAGIQHYDRNVRSTMQIDGAIASVGGKIFATNRIHDAFAVIDVGTPNIDVRYQNRPVGRTNENGMIFVPDLNSYEPNLISIDPIHLPIDANIPETKKIVVPTAQSGLIVRFGISKNISAALVNFVDSHRKSLEVGLTGRLKGKKESFIVGYDGETYIRDLSAMNIVEITKADGSLCRAQFPYKPNPGHRVTIRNAVCL